MVDFHLRDNGMGTRGKGLSVRVNVRYSKIEEEVAEKGPDVLCQKHLETKENKLRTIALLFHMEISNVKSDMQTKWQKNVA